MADIYMHQRLALDVYKQYPNLDKAYLLLGSQGPDPYYYGLFSHEKKQIRAIGDRLHDTNINKMFAAMIEHINQRYSNELYSYFVGFLLHFALDVKIHPYVYHHVGVYQGEPELRSLHLRFERRIDAILIHEDQGKKGYRYPLYKTSLPFKKAPKIINDLFQDVVQRTLDDASGGRYFKEGYKGMRFTLKHVLRDRTGFKHLIYKLLDRVNKTGDLCFQDLSFRKLKFNDFDYLNRLHQPWYHPITNEPSMKSIDDLYLDAYEMGIDLIEKTREGIKNGAVLDIKTIFQNRSFNSGIDARDKRSMQYFNIYTDHLL